MLRIWANRINLTHPLEELFGSVGNNPKKGKLIIRVETPKIQNLQKKSIPQHAWSNQPCIPAGEKFTLHILGEKKYQEDAEKITIAWITLGGIGLRKNRAAGSTWGEIANLEKAKELLKKQWKAKALTSRNSEELRALCSDTLEEKAFERQNKPLGGVNPRQPSAIEFKIAPKGNTHELIAFYPTAAIQDLEAAGKVLTNSNKKIGEFLQNL